MVVNSTMNSPATRWPAVVDAEHRATDVASAAAHGVPDPVEEVVELALAQAEVDEVLGELVRDCR